MAKRKVLSVDVNRRAFQRVRTCNDALAITVRDMQGPILTRLAQLHRKQERRIFVSEGREGARGRWADLSPEYERYKSRIVNEKILVFSGDMRERFISPSRSEYIERFVLGARKGDKVEGGTFEFGARSEIAQHHFLGSTSTRRSRPGRGKNKKKGKRAKPFVPKTFTVRLPRRDMVTKSNDQVVELRQAVVDWYRNERVPQVARECNQQLAAVKTP